MKEPRDDALAEYRRKRDFSKTAEPAGAVATRRDGHLHFVIQKHEATTLHYDLRLEVHGVMKSWAVPRGLSVDPGDKRLAMEVEDHPMEYNTFEGTIPEGEYGGGTVLLWDRGTYWPDEAGEGEDHESAMAKAHAAGKISFSLKGERLRGSWALVRTEAGAKPKWLVIKHRDRHAKPGFDITEAYVTSVETERTLEEIAEDAASETWSSAAIAPMLASMADELPGGRGWIFEPKHEGTRLHAYVTAGAVRLLEHGRDVTRRFPTLVERLAALAGDNAGLVFDGVIAGDGDFYVSDLLFAEGEVLLEEAWSVRRARLEEVLSESVEGIRPVEVLHDERSAKAAARKAGWPGIIAKRRDSTYQSGQQSEDWITVE